MPFYSRVKPGPSSILLPKELVTNLDRCRPSEDVLMCRRIASLRVDLVYYDPPGKARLRLGPHREHSFRKTEKQRLCFFHISSIVLSKYRVPEILLG